MSTQRDELRKLVNETFGLNVPIPSTYNERINYCNDFADRFTILFQQAELQGRIDERKTLEIDFAGLTSFTEKGFEDIARVNVARIATLTNQLEAITRSKEEK